MKQILILGANGKIGKLMQNSLLTYDCAEFKFYYHSRHAISQHNLEFDLKNLDISINSLSKLNVSFDAILNLTGDRIGKNFSLNSELSMNCCHIADYFNIPLVLLMSTSAVYGNYKDCFSEDDQCLPVNQYGESKLLMEKNCLKSFSNKLDVCCLRLGNFYGADQLCQNIRMSKAIELDVFEDQLSPNRTYINTTAFIHLIVKLINNHVKLPNILNIGQPGKVSMKSILDYHNYDYTLKFSNLSNYQNILLNLKKLKNIVGNNTLAPFVIEKLKL